MPLGDVAACGWPEVDTGGRRGPRDERLHFHWARRSGRSAWTSSRRPVREMGAVRETLAAPLYGKIAVAGSFCSRSLGGSPATSRPGQTEAAGGAGKRQEVARGAGRALAVRGNRSSGGR